MSKARRKSRGSRGSLEDDDEIAGLPWRPFVVLVKPTDGAKKSVDAALATLAPLSDHARLEAQKNAPAPAPEIPDSPLPAGSAVQAVKKRTKRRDPPPLTVQPQVCEIPSAALGCVYDIPLSITVRPGGKVRLDVSSKNLRVVERPRHSIAPGETENAIIEYAAGSQGPIQEFVDVLAQFGTVRVPIVGWVDAPQGGPCSPSTVTES